MNLRIAALLVSVTAGCATSPGDTLFSRQQFRSAVDAYDSELKSRPGDADLLRKRDEARLATLGELARLRKDAVKRGETDAALEWATEVLSLNEAWGNPPAAAQIVGAQRAWLEAQVVGGIDQQLAAGAPLRALGLFMKTRERAKELWSGERATATEARIQAAGRARCETARGNAQRAGPFARHLVARYCAAFGVAPGELPTLPGLYGRADIDARLPGVDDAELGPLREELQRAFQATAWHDPQSERSLRVVTGGELQEIWLTIVTVTTRDHRGFTQTSTSRQISLHRRPTPPRPPNSFVVGYTARLFADIREPKERSAKVEPVQPHNEYEVKTRETIRDALKKDGNRVGQRLEVELFQLWGELHCRPEEQEVEAASRCMYGQTEAKGQTGVARLFGDSTPEPKDAVFLAPMVE